MKKRDLLFRIFSIGFSYAWLVLFAFIPLVFVCVVSFLVPSNTHFFDFKLTFHNYVNLFDPLYLRIFGHSIFIALITTLGCIVIAYPFAYMLSQMKSHIRSLLLVLTIIPFWTSSLIRSYAMMIILRTKGLLNILLLHLGVIHQPLHILFTETAVVIGLIYNLLPFMILPLYSNMEKFDHRLIDAAYDLGARRVRVFLKIIFPLTIPGMLAGTLLVFLPAMSLFYIPNILGGAKSVLVGNLIQEQFLMARNWPMGSVVSIVLTCIMLVLLAIYQFSTKTKSEKQVLL